VKLPAFQFYPADWRKDPGVQSLSFHDRGVWFEILCLMHESDQRGRLLLNGKPMPDEALARLLGLDKQTLTKTLSTLIDFGVASRDENGALVNRRMVRDENLRKIRQEAGKLGGNPNLLNQNTNQNTTTQVKQIPTPSVASSSSAPIASSSSEPHVAAATREGDEITAEVIAKLQKEPAYKALNVQFVADKLLVHCKQKGRVATSDRLISWLNRENPDQPQHQNGNHKKRKAEIPG
jgi:DNA-binding Lrp family transcriptional regulator